MEHVRTTREPVDARSRKHPPNAAATRAPTQTDENRRTRQECPRTEHTGPPEWSQDRVSRPPAGRHREQKHRRPPHEYGLQAEHEADQETTVPGAPRPRDSRSGRLHLRQRHSQHERNRRRRVRQRRPAPPGTGSRAGSRQRPPPHRGGRKKSRMYHCWKSCFDCLGAKEGRRAEDIKGQGTAGMEAP